MNARCLRSSRNVAAILALLAVSAVAATAETSKSDTAAIAKAAVGSYEGAFGRNKIVIRLENIDGKTASGYSEVGNNRRPFSGTVSVRGGTPQFEVREPGDNPHDGVFRFEFSPEQQTLAGTWTPNNKKLASIEFTAAKSAAATNTAKDSSAERSGRETGTSGHTDGTLVRIETRGSHNYFILKEKEGREQAFASLSQDMTQLSYLAGPEMHGGTRMRIHWEIDTLPGTHEQVKSVIEISEGGSNMYIPAKGSAESEAIIAAVAADYHRRYKKKATITGAVRVENDWAGLSGTAKEPGKEGPGAIWVAILRGSGTKWKVVGTSEGDEKPRKGAQENDRPHWDEYERLRKQYPDAPVSIIGLLDYP